MPGSLTFYDNVIVLRFEFSADGRNCFFSNAALDVLAFAIFGVQRLSERHCSGHIPRHQQVQSRFGGLEPAGGIQARSELETDLMSSDADRGLGDSLEGGKAGTTRGVQF